MVDEVRAGASGETEQAPTESPRARVGIHGGGVGDRIYSAVITLFALAVPVLLQFDGQLDQALTSSW